MSAYYDAFISYGRADSKAFAIKLYQDLTQAGFKIWFDQNDIPLAVDFQDRIDNGIERAHNFLFIISPHSVNSPYCLKEIELAVKYKKRIIPLLHVEEITKDTWQQRNPDKTEADWGDYLNKGHHCCYQNMHPEIGKINWIPFVEKVDNYDKSFADLIQTLRRHKDYVEKHTQILVGALEWERNQKLTRYLLIGKERREAEQWLKIAFTNEEQPCLPADLQCEFICESIKNANNLMTQVFLSYSDKNRETMETIRNYLMRHGITVWTNQTDIKTGSEFQQAINRGIEGADNFLFLLSPESLESEYSRQEFAHACSLGKRLITLLIKPTNLEDIPQNLQKLQFINLTVTEEEKYQHNLDILIKELAENAVYYREHKILLVKGLKWKEQKQNPSLLLRGYNLDRYQSWLEIAEKKQLHPPTDLQREFIAESAKQPPDLALDVFVSYSRADSDFARKLNDALQTQGKTTWFDQESIATGTDFQAEIYRGIEQSDNFLFVISPDSVNSPYCADEVEYARSINKRLVTVLHRQVNSEELHPELAKVQWLDFNRYGGDFYSNFSELVRTLDTDRDRVREHTKMSQAALEWKRGNKSIDLLLRGSEYARAYEWWRRARSQDKQPAVTDEVEEFIIESKAEVERLQTAERRRKNTIAAAAVGTILFLSGLSIFAWQQKSEAQRQSTIAFARQLAAESHGNLDRNLYQSGTLLALESMSEFQKLDLPSVTADGALREGLSLLPDFVWGTNHDERVNAVAFSADGRYLATASGDRTARLWDVATGKELAKLSHDESVNALAFSPDSKYLATASWDNTCRVWDVATGKELAKLSHDGRVEAVAFSPDGKYLATASNDKTARVWDASTGREIARLERDGQVFDIAFSPDSKYVAAASNDGTAVVWGLVAGKELFKLDRYGSIFDVAFSPDGKYLATASSDNTARIWDASTGKEVAKLHSDEWVLAVTFSSNSKYVATGSADKTARIWDVATGKEIAKLHSGDRVEAVAFSPDGKYLATASSDKTARIWDVATGEETAKVNHQDGVFDVAFSNNGEYLATASADKTALVWKVKTGNEVVKLHRDGRVLDVAFSNNGEYLAAASSEKTTLVFSLSTGSFVAKLSHDGPVEAVSFSSDSKYVATASLDHTARVWDAKTGLLVAKLSHDGPVKTVVFSNDGKYAATASADKTARVWDAETGSLVAKLSHDGTVKAVVFSNDGKYVATASNDKTARVWETSTGKEVAKLDRHSPVNAVAFSSDDRYLAAASLESSAQVWDAATGSLVVKLSHDKAVNAVTFSPDDKYVATASNDNTARVWDAGTGKKVAKLSHDGAVEAVTFSNDSKYVATASWDKTARVWDATTGQEVAKLSHDGPVKAVAFSPDGKYLATASWDKTARVHFLNSQDLIEEACRRLGRNLTASEWERYMNLDLDRYDKTCDNLPIHRSVLVKSRELAKEGQVKEAVAIFRRTLKLEPAIDLNPETEEIDNDPETVARELARLEEEE